MLIRALQSFVVNRAGQGALSVLLPLLSTLLFSLGAQSEPISLHRAVHRQALSLAVASSSFSKAEIHELQAAADSGAEPAKGLSERWERLISLAQGILLIRELPTFHPVGFEFETAHNKYNSSQHFARGADALMALTAKHFGQGEVTQVTHTMAERKASLIDRSGERWIVESEFVRRGAESIDGWELVTPPQRHADNFKLLVPMLIDLEASKFGRARDLSSAHLTIGLSEGSKSNPRIEALAAVNFLLMIEQFLPAISEMIATERYGGIAKNFFARPAGFDHRQLLQELSATEAKNLNWRHLHGLLFETHIQREFEAQLKSTPVYSKAEKAEKLKHMSVEERRSYNANWKYRPWRIRFDKSNAGFAVEVRIADYNGKPEQILRSTLLFELLMTSARRLAEQNKVWQIQLPQVRESVSSAKYYAELRQMPSSSKEALMTTLRAVAIDESVLSYLDGQKIPVRGALWSAQKKRTFGFEVETTSPEFVSQIVPYDPDLKTRWSKLNTFQRHEVLKSLGFVQAAAYSNRARRVLATNFFADFQSNPKLDADLHLEESGNVEFKSSGSGIETVAQLERETEKAVEHVRSGRFGVHLHAFLPNEAIIKLRESGRVDEFVDFLEHLSFAMQVFDYREAADSARPRHSLDSWSLDRYAPSELEAIRSWLKGDSKLGNLDQKFHNIGFRPVRNGLDLEVRAVSKDISYGSAILSIIEASFNEMDFSDRVYLGDKPLFHDFRDPLIADKREYTFAWAVAEKFKASAAQVSIAQKLQFEIFKPSMSDFMVFPGWEAVNTVSSKELSTEFLRTNFESNSALALLDYESQSFLSDDDIRMIQQKRNEFLERLFALIKRVENDPAYAFLRQNKDFHYLCSYLDRSTHASRPRLDLVDEKTASVQRDLLEQLVFEVRGLSARFVKDSNLPSKVIQSVKLNDRRPVYSARNRVKTLAPVIMTSAPTGSQTAKRAPISCREIFKW